MSRHVATCRVELYCVVRCHVVSCRVVSNRVRSCRVVSRCVVSCRTMSRPVVSSGSVAIPNADFGFGFMPYLLMFGFHFGRFQGVLPFHSHFRITIFGSNFGRLQDFLAVHLVSPFPCLLLVSRWLSITAKVLPENDKAQQLAWWREVRGEGTWRVG